ncbi:MAG: protein-L-isoaspartate(D-aspartate) O-methyltransferase [Rhodospirillales bacterium]|nr:protein-L-isoaspartate(D-aspartate) O-methyltransferase [Rhodospirillales bacterium]
MSDSELEKAHRRLIEEIEMNARETENFTGRGRFSNAVMAAMAKVPRHEFLGDNHQGVAYSNRPQSIGFGQTISQPYIVAVMTDLLDLKPTDKVLEIGTGSGYQAAVLAEVTGHVYSMESVRSLAASAAKRLKRLGYDAIKLRHGDGYTGWEEEAPFDAILVTAAPETIPRALCDQLKVGGRMILPVGRQFSPQILKRGIKLNDGRVSFRSTLPVAFVPMVKGPKEEH